MIFEKMQDKIHWVFRNLLNKSSPFHSLSKIPLQKLISILETKVLCKFVNFEYLTESVIQQLKSFPKGKNVVKFSAFR